MLIKNLGIVDYVVMGGVLAISVLVGIFTACTGTKQRTTSEFLVGDRSMELLPVSLSVLATFTSGITVLGMPEENYRYGIDFWWILLAISMAIPAVAHLYLPIFYNLQITSVYEYIGLRFSNIIRLLASSIYALQVFIYMSVVLYAPALAISHLTGLSVWTSVLTTGFVCTFYTSIGGIKAVIWTDMFQILLIMASLFSIVIQGARILGVEYIWEKSIEGKRLHFPDYSIDPLKRHTVWSLSFGGYFMWLYIYGINQSMVQRYVTLPSLRRAQLCVWLNYPMLILTISLTSMVGLILYGFYSDCDPYTAKKISGREQILPYFVMTKLVKFQGLPGLFLAGLFSGALSTMSSGMNSLAAITVTDVIRPHFGGMEENVATHVTKFLVFFYGALCMGFVSIIERLGSVLTLAATFFGAIGGPLAGLFTLGIFFPWANSKGAGIGLVAGLFFSMWIGVCELIYDPYHEQAPISVAGCSANPASLFKDQMSKDIPGTFNNATNLDFDLSLNSSNDSIGMNKSPHANISVEKIENLPENFLGNLIDSNQTYKDFKGKSRKRREALGYSQLKSLSDHEEGLQRNAQIPVIYRISYLWFSGIGCLTTIIIGLIISVITGVQDPNDLDPRLVCDVMGSFCCCMPNIVKEMLWPNVGMDYISEEAAVALLKRKSPPPEIITTEARDADDVLKQTKGRNVHFNQRSGDSNDEEMYPFDVGDVPYGVIVNQDYEDFKKMANGSDRINVTDSSSSNSRRKPKVVAQVQPQTWQKSNTISTDVVHPQSNPYASKYTNTKNKYQARTGEPENIQMQEMGPGRRQRRESDENHQSLTKKRSTSTERSRGSFSNKDSPNVEKQRLNRPTQLILANQKSKPTQKVRHRSSDASEHGSSTSRKQHQNPHQGNNFQTTIHNQNIQQGHSMQKRQPKRMLSHEAERKHHLREKTYVRPLVMSD